MKNEKRRVIIYDRIPRSELKNKKQEWYLNHHQMIEYCLKKDYEIIKVFSNHADDSEGWLKGFQELCEYIRKSNSRVQLLVNYLSRGHELDHLFYMGFTNGQIESEDLQTICTTFPVQCEDPESKILFMDMTVERTYIFDDSEIVANGEEDLIIDDLKKGNALLYTRCNSAKFPIEELLRQEILLRKYCQENKINIINSYKEIASPFDFDRIEFLKMLSFIEENPGLIDYIYVSSWDRFSRSAGASLSLIKELKNKGVEVVAVSQILDEDVVLTKHLLSKFMNEFVIKGRNLVIHSLTQTDYENK